MPDERPVLVAGGRLGKDGPPRWHGGWTDNAGLIAAVARLHYLDGRVLDATYGLGAFWRDFQPDDLWTNDLYVEGCDSAHDYRKFPADWSRQFDAVVFDPDYKLNGTPAMGEFDDRYGIAKPVTREQRMDSILDGAAECFRVARRFLLVKCMDQVESGRQWWQGDLITGRVAMEGGRKVEEFYLFGGGIPQPKDRTKKCPACNGAGCWIDGNTERPCAACAETGRVPSEQQHGHGRPSKLLIFKRPGRMT